MTQTHGRSSWWDWSTRSARLRVILEPNHAAEIAELNNSTSERLCDTGSIARFSLIHLERLDAGRAAPVPQMPTARRPRKDHPQATPATGRTQARLRSRHTFGTRLPLPEGALPADRPEHEGDRGPADRVVAKVTAVSSPSILSASCLSRCAGRARAYEHGPMRGPGTPRVSRAYDDGAAICGNENNARRSKALHCERWPWHVHRPSIGSGSGSVPPWVPLPRRSRRPICRCPLAVGRTGRLAAPRGEGLRARRRPAGDPDRAGGRRQDADSRSRSPSTSPSPGRSRRSSSTWPRLPIPIWSRPPSPSPSGCKRAALVRSWT